MGLLPRPLPSRLSSGGSRWRAAIGVALALALAVRLAQWVRWAAVLGSAPWRSFASGLRADWAFGSAVCAVTVLAAASLTAAAMVAAARQRRWAAWAALGVGTSCVVRLGYRALAEGKMGDPWFAFADLASVLLAAVFLLLRTAQAPRERLPPNGGSATKIALLLPAPHGALAFSSPDHWPLLLSTVIASVAAVVASVFADRGRRGARVCLYAVAILSTVLGAACWQASVLRDSPNGDWLALVHGVIVAASGIAPALATLGAARPSNGSLAIPAAPSP